MRLLDRGGAIIILDRGVPPFPSHLAGKLAAARMVAEDRDGEKQFFAEYAKLCALHHLSYPAGGTAEDYVHLRRLLAKHTLADLKRWAVEFLKDHGETLEGGYHHHLRLFSAWIKEQ